MHTHTKHITHTHVYAKHTYIHAYAHPYTRKLSNTGIRQVHSQAHKNEREDTVGLNTMLLHHYLREKPAPAPVCVLLFMR